MKSFLIDSNDAGQRLDKFVIKVTSGFPKGMLYKAIRKKRIKVNGKRGDIAQMLQTGDRVELYINDEFFQTGGQTDFTAAPATLDLLYEDENILLTCKPAGLKSHSDSPGESDTLIQRVKHYLYESKQYIPEKENSFAPALCNRIDRNTQGIVIAAKNAPALREMNQKIKQRELQKFYLCAVRGTPSPPHALLTAYWKKDAEKNRAVISGTPGSDTKEIQTEYTLLRGGGSSLLEILLHTGRSHQIRAHMAFIGHPLVGDAKYGGKDPDHPHQLLCAYKLGFAFADDTGVLGYLKGQVFTLPEHQLPKELK